jgi:hypothetical protein
MSDIGQFPNRYLIRMYSFIHFSSDIFQLFLHEFQLFFHENLRLVCLTSSSSSRRSCSIRLICSRPTIARVSAFPTDCIVEASPLKMSACTSFTSVALKRGAPSAINPLTEAALPTMQLIMMYVLASTTLRHARNPPTEKTRTPISTPTRITLSLLLLGLRSLGFS